MADITDPRIAAIMAKLQGKPSPDEQSPAEEEKEEEVIKAPKTLEEFIELEKLRDWPRPADGEALWDLSAEKELLGTKEDIMKKLSDSAPIGIHMITELEEKLGRLEQRLRYYSDQILTDEKRPIRAEDKLFLSPSKAFMTELPGSNPKQSNQNKAIKQNMQVTETMEESKRKNVDYCSFPGFIKGELTELPGQLEALQVLHRVTKAQDFRSGFKKFWKKIFLSEASVAIMQDGFWWFFLDHFERGRLEEQDQLFDRVADSFVALITSINPEIKDKFFQMYPDALAQAVYACFHEAFPDSQNRFTEDFKQSICNTIGEWLTGVKPTPRTFSKWNVRRLEPKVAVRSTVEEETTDAAKNMIKAAASNNKVKLSLDVGSFESMVRHLGEPETGRVVPDSATRTSREVTKLTNLTAQTGSTIQGQATSYSLSASRQAQCGTPRREVKESHVIGPGPSYERVMFNIKGRSPLVSHYLQMHRLKDGNQPGRRVRRTEIKEVPGDALTYRQFIHNTMDMSDALAKEYQRICEQTAWEIYKIEKKKKQASRQIDRLQKELLNTRSNLELKILTDKIMDKRERGAPMRASLLKKRDHMAKKKEEVDEDEEEEEEENYADSLHQQ